MTLSSPPDVRDHVPASTAPRRLAVLGPLIVRTGAKVTSPGAGRQRRLLTILAVAAGRDRSVTVDEMVDALYGADASPRTRHSLATELWRARQVVGADSIVTDLDGYRLDVRRCEVDTVLFEAQLAEGRALLRAGDFADAQVRLAGALSLWRGEPLGEWRDHPLAQAAATRLTELRAGGAVDHAEALIGTGRHHDAVQLLDAVTADEPTREHAWALLVEACLETGQLRHARAAYDTARRTLAEYGVEVGAELRVAAERLLATPSTEPARPAVARPRTALVGRDAELAAVLVAATTAVRDSDPALVLVSGEAGIGKTALIEQAATELEATFPGRLVVGRVRCDERLDLPFAALVPLLTRLAARCPNVSSDVATLIDPSVEPHPAGPPASADAGRKRLVDAIAELLESAARDTPQLVLVDDAHWATAAVLDAVLHVCARRAAVPLCVLVTVREPSGRHPEVAHLLGEVRRRAGAHVLLRGLDESAAAQLLGAETSTEHVHRAHWLSGGNPLYLTQLARMGTLDHVAATRSATLAASIQDHLSCLPAEDRDVLRLAAVVGTQFDVRIVTAAAARAEPPISLITVLDAIDAAAGAGLLQVAADDVHQASFVHALVRDQLYADLPAHARRVAHALVGRASEGLVSGDEPSLDLIAHHYSAGWPECPTASVVGRLYAAGNQAAAQLGLTKAHEYYARALDLAAMDPTFHEPTVVASVLEASAHVALARAGEQVAAEPGVSDAAPVQEPRAAFAAMRRLAIRERLAEVRLRAALGTLSTHSVERMTGAPLDELDAALTGLLDEEASGVAGAHVSDAIAALFLHRPARGRVLLERAVEADPAASHQLLRAVWEREDVAGKLATARRLAADPGADPLGAWLRLWVSEVGAGQRALDDPPPVLGTLPEPSETASWELTVWQIATAIATGRFDRAHRLIAAARRSVGGTTSAATTVSRLATLMAQELRLSMLQSTRRPSACEVAVPKQTWTQSYPIMVAWRGYAAAAVGQLAAAHAACDTLVEDLRDGRVPAGELLAVVSGLAMAAVDVAHPAGIDAAYAALAPHAGHHATNNFSVYWGAVDHHLARLAAARGDLDDAVERFESAAVAHRHAGARPWEARSLHGLAAASWHRGRTGDRETAAATRRLAVALATGDEPIPSIGHAAWPPVTPVG